MHIGAYLHLHTRIYTCMHMWMHAISAKPFNFTTILCICVHGIVACHGYVCVHKYFTQPYFTCRCTLTHATWQQDSPTLDCCMVDIIHTHATHTHTHTWEWDSSLRIVAWMLPLKEYNTRTHEQCRIFPNASWKRIAHVYVCTYVCVHAGTGIHICMHPYLWIAIAFQIWRPPLTHIPHAQHHSIIDASFYYWRYIHYTRRNMHCYTTSST